MQKRQWHMACAGGTEPHLVGAGQPERGAGHQAVQGRAGATQVCLGKAEPLHRPSCISVPTWSPLLQELQNLASRHPNLVITRLGRCPEVGVPGPDSPFCAALRLPQPWRVPGCCDTLGAQHREGAVPTGQGGHRVLLSWGTRGLQASTGTRALTSPVLALQMSLTPPASRRLQPEWRSSWGARG